MLVVDNRDMNPLLYSYGRSKIKLIATLFPDTSSPLTVNKHNGPTKPRRLSPGRGRVALHYTQLYSSSLLLTRLTVTPLGVISRRK